jgi:hypothetical protein
VRPSGRSKSAGARNGHRFKPSPATTATTEMGRRRDTPAPVEEYNVICYVANKAPREDVGPLPALLLARGPLPSHEWVGGLTPFFLRPTRERVTLI